MEQLKTKETSSAFAELDPKNVKMKADLLKPSLTKINCANFPIRRFRVRFLRIGSRRPVDPRNSLAFFAEHSHPRFGAAQSAFEVFHSVLRPASEDIRTH